MKAKCMVFGHKYEYVGTTHLYEDGELTVYVGTKFSGVCTVCAKEKTHKTSNTCNELYGIMWSKVKRKALGWL